MRKGRQQAVGSGVRSVGEDLAESGIGKFDLQKGDAVI